VGDQAPRVLLIGLLALVASTRVAEASWFYTYSCSGTCAPDQLAAVGTSGPFNTYADCEAVRNADPRLYTNQQSGSLGGLSLCFESDRPPGPGGEFDNRPAPPFQSVGIGLMGGPGYVTPDDTGTAAAGIDVVFTIGGKPNFGLVLRTGILGSHIADNSDASAGLGIFWPLQIGATISPGSARNRVEFGADGGLEVALSCRQCPGGGASAIGTLRVGLVHYFGSTMDFKRGDRAGRPGLVFEVLKEFRSGELDGGIAMFRLSFRARNDVLSW
jgi:hypothetical protein